MNSRIRDPYSLRSSGSGTRPKREKRHIRLRVLLYGRWQDDQIENLEHSNALPDLPPRPTCPPARLLATPLAVRELRPETSRQMQARGFSGIGRRNNQPELNRRITTIFPAPCHSPMFLARVRGGMASQSTNPKIEKINPPRIPAAIIQ